jgi:P pilus assembly chaperone PapD
MKANHYLFIIMLIAQSAYMNAQSVSISPSRLYFKTPVGEMKTQEVSITNNSSASQSFTVSFSDFEAAGNQGKSQFMKAGESVNSCADWLNATPSFFEIGPGETQKIKILLQVPSTPEANKVKWAAMQVKITKEKKDPGTGDKTAIGMGVTETFQFVVHIFQSPPSVTFKNAEIKNFREITSVNDTCRVLSLLLKNSGEAILDCAAYIEMTNVNTGNEVRQKPIAFTVLPGSEREIKFTIPSNTPKGKYSVLGVVDYGSRENVQAAEIEVQF